MNSVNPTESDRNAKLIEAGLALSSELSLSAVLQRIVELAAEISGARYGALAVLRPAGGIAQFLTTGISDEEREAIGALPEGRGVLGALIEDLRPLRLSDVRADPRSVGFPPNHPPMRSFLGAPVEARGTVFGNIYLAEKQGADEFDEQDERALVVLATQAGVAIENARLYEETRRREQWLDAVRQIATAILAGAGSDEALELVAHRARELLHADLATIAVPEGEGTLILKVADGSHADELRGRTFPVEGSLSGEVISTGMTVVLQDVSADSRANQPIVRLSEMGPAIFVPLSVRGTAFGTVAVANLAGGRRFSDEDLRLAESFADQAAIALEYARAQREIQRLVVLEDRERIAKELHDGVIQSLFAVGMELEATAALSEDQDIERQIEGASADVDRVIRDLRNYIFGLRPGILADRRLDEALRELVADFQERTGIVTVADVDVRAAAELSSSASEVVQMAREALSNVNRHARADTCRVALRQDDAHVVLEIDDDGKGFDPNAVAGSGFGLTNLRERAKALGGEARIESSPADGTTVRITIPV